jgi:hypothetical protein
VLLWALLCLHAPAVHAFFDQFQVIPEAPTEGTPFNFRFRTGQCHGVFADRPPYPIVSRTGESIEITAAIGDNSGSPSFCIFPIGPVTYSLPPLPAGSYQIELYTVDVLNNPNVRVLRTQLPFQVVAGAPPQGVPINASWALVLLSLLIGALAVRRLAS